MTLSATMSLANSAVTSGQPTTIIITITNTSSTADTISSTAKKYPGRAEGIGGNSLPEGGVINGSGTLSGVTTFSYQEVFPTSSQEPMTVAPAIQITTGAGTILAVSGPTLTINPIPLTVAAVNARTQVGMLDFGSNIFEPAVGLVIGVI